MSENMIEADNLVKIYKSEDTEVVALSGFELSVKRGELVGIVGSSGSGKSTFLNMIGGLDRPSAGRLYVDGKDLFRMNAAELVEYKKNTVGFVWQNNARNLLPYLSAVENIMVPMHFSGKYKNKRQRALELLELVGLADKKDNVLAQLSGGEQQRVAIAIALANEPVLLLADEPTGSVDSRTADRILDIFKKLNTELGVTVVIVSHDTALTKKLPRVVLIRDGRVSSEKTLMEGYADLNDADFDWLGADTQIEKAVIDRVGRIQLPAHMLEKLGVEDRRVSIRYEDGRIIIEK